MKPDQGQRLCIVQSKNRGLNSLADQSPVTAVEYGTFQRAYDEFNAALFEGRLPQVLITLQRHGRARGYFSCDRFQRRDGIRKSVHEVALNPDSFAGRTDEEILSTLAHEMAHVWQQEFGHPGRGRYHNREWAAMMFSIGLMPSATGEPGGAVTGDHVSHFILENGLFHDVCRAFLGKHCLVWESAGPAGATRSSSGQGKVGIHPEPRKTQTRAKFTCPNCGLNAWAKPDALFDCHSCSIEASEPVLMYPVESLLTTGEMGDQRSDGTIRERRGHAR
jgi:hypothetical protein